MSQRVIVSNYLSFLNQQKTYHEVLAEHYRKINTHLKMLLGREFLNQPKEKIYNSLLALNKFITEANDLNVHLLNTIINMMKRVSQPHFNEDDKLH